MGRQIRLTHAAAIAAGLLDPAIAELTRRPDATASPRASQPKAATPSAKTKRKRTKSKPAVHPKVSPGPAGSGSLFLDVMDEVYAAEFAFDLVPVPKERPRVVRNTSTNGVVSYTPARTKYFTAEIKKVVASVLGLRRPISGPVVLDMTFVMQIPTSWPKWRQEAALDGLIAPTGRPDMDNLEKALLDAFNETLIVDDAFVVERHARKIYGSMPAILVRVEKMNKLELGARRGAVDALRSALSEQD